MIHQVVLCVPERTQPQRSHELEAFQALARELTRMFDCAVTVSFELPSDPIFRLQLRHWRSEALDLLALDNAFHWAESDQSPYALVLDLDDPLLDRLPIVQILSRYQRLLPAPRSVSKSPQLLAALALHGSLHDLSKPLVQADFDHSLDTWRWVVRLNPHATLALQVAALFHDVERLFSEAAQRVEQRAVNYSAFKRAHATRGAEQVRALLTSLELEATLVARSTQLIAQHEKPASDPELQCLNDADCLSFFCLNSWGFFKYFGIEHTRKKVAYTLARMTRDARRKLSGFRYHPEVLRLLCATLGAPTAADASIQAVS